jgi:hypothetical protein
MAVWTGVGSDTPIQCALAEMQICVPPHAHAECTERTGIVDAGLNSFLEDMGCGKAAATQQVNGNLLITALCRAITNPTCARSTGR